MAEHPVTIGAEYHFDPAHNPTDRHRLSRVLLEGAEDRRLQDPEWLEFMGRCIEYGSRSVNSIQNANSITLSRVARIRQARSRCEQEMGLHDEGHPLYKAFASRQAMWPPLPSVLIDTVAALDEITGDGVQAINSHTLLITNTGSALRRRVALMERCARTLGWEGDVRQLVARDLQYLMRSSNDCMTLAHLASRHGDPQDTHLDITAVHKFARLPIEAHMLAAAEREDYKFGDIVSEYNLKKKLGLTAARKRIHEALADNTVVQRLGPAVIRTYLRSRPLNDEIVAAAPHLNAYLPRKNRKPATPLRYVTGSETWLKGLRVAKRKRVGEIAAELNALIEAGSKDLRGRHTNDSLSSDVVDARAALFEALGIINRQHPSYDTVLRFMDQEPTLISPQIVLSYCELMSTYGVKQPLAVIRQTPHILLRPGQIEAILVAAGSGGVDINTALQYHPTLLLNNATKISEILRACRTAVRAAAAEKDKTLPEHIPEDLCSHSAPDESFDALRYKEDFAALYLVTLDTEQLQDQQWIKKVMLAAEIASQRFHRNRPQRTAITKDMLAVFEDATGLRNSDHPLFVAYSRAVKQGTSPLSILRSVKTVQALTGQALTTIMQTGRLLTMEQKTLSKTMRHLEKLAIALGWKGDVQELTTECPNVLASSRANRMIAARLAKKYATERHTTMSHAGIASFLHAVPEAHLLEILQSSTYSFGDKVSSDQLNKIGVKNARKYIHEAIVTPEGAAKLGPGVINAYLRFHPLPKDGRPDS